MAREGRASVVFGHRRQRVGVGRVGHNEPVVVEMARPVTREGENRGGAEAMIARYPGVDEQRGFRLAQHARSDEHTSEIQSLMRISYAVFCLNKRNTKTDYHSNSHQMNY